MRYHEIKQQLLEYKTEITVQKQGDRLKQAADRIERNQNLSPLQVVQGLEQMDPTPNKKYMSWIIKQYISGKMRLEDYPRINAAIAAYHSAKPQLPQKQRDINRFDLHQLETLVDSFADSAADSDSRQMASFKNRDDIQVLYQGPLGLLAVPKTEQASCELGSGTKWCTAAKNNNMFDHYAYDGPLYVFIEKPGNAKYQFHFESQQFMDSKDRPISLEKMAEFRDHPVLKKLFAKKEADIVKDPDAAYQYARDVIRGRWPEAEATIANHPGAAHAYAADIIGGRWPEAEATIARHPGAAYEYANEVIKGRWPEAEATIAMVAGTAFRYAKDVIKGQWPEAEATIAEDPHSALLYSQSIIKGRFPLGEKAIAKDPQKAFTYARNILEGRFFEGEKAIAKDPEAALLYATHIFGGRFPKGEKAIAKSAVAAYQYARMIRGRFPEGEKAIKTNSDLSRLYTKFVDRLEKQ